LRILISARPAYAIEHIFFDQVHQRMRHGGSVIMESAPRQLRMHIIEAFGLGEPAFFPEFLDYAAARFSSRRGRLAFGLGLG